MAGGAGEECEGEGADEIVAGKGTQRCGKPPLRLSLFSRPFPCPPPLPCMLLLTQAGFALLCPAGSQPVAVTVAPRPRGLARTIPNRHLQSPPHALPAACASGGHTYRSKLCSSHPTTRTLACARRPRTSLPLNRPAQPCPCPLCNPHTRPTAQPPTAHLYGLPMRCCRCSPLKSEEPVTYS